MATKYFTSVNELKIDAIGTYVVNGWTINVTEKISGGWKGTMKHESGKEKSFDNSITHIRKKALANGINERKPKAGKTTIVGTTKKLTTSGIKLLTFNDFENQAGEMLAEYKKAVEIVNNYNAIFQSYNMPNKLLSLIEYQKEKQNENVKKIRENQRVKRIFAQRYELAVKHLEKLEKDLVKLVMLDKLSEIPELKRKINEQKTHVENMKKQSEKF